MKENFKLLSSTVRNWRKGSSPRRYYSTSGLISDLKEAGFKASLLTKTDKAMYNGVYKFVRVFCAGRMLYVARNSGSGNLIRSTLEFTLTGACQSSGNLSRRSKDKCAGYRLCRAAYLNKLILAHKAIFARIGAPETVEEEKKKKTCALPGSAGNTGDAMKTKTLPAGQNLLFPSGTTATFIRKDGKQAVYRCHSTRELDSISFVSALEYAREWEEKKNLDNPEIPAVRAQWEAIYNAATGEGWQEREMEFQAACSGEINANDTASEGRFDVGTVAYYRCAIGSQEMALQYAIESAPEIAEEEKEIPLTQEASFLMWPEQVYGGDGPWNSYGGDGGGMARWKPELNNMLASAKQFLDALREKGTIIDAPHDEATEEHIRKVSRIRVATKNLLAAAE